ncbi:uncharacterized protein DS421_15g494340 [Arachis hypogaea]|nr:uncharacterized protein DS421_15g494340 [Arachis hypogaea]
MTSFKCQHSFLNPDLIAPSSICVTQLFKSFVVFVVLLLRPRIAYKRNHVIINKYHKFTYVHHKFMQVRSLELP